MRRFFAGLGVATALSLAASVAAQPIGGSAGGRGQQRPPLIGPGDTQVPNFADPEGRDAIELYSRLCVSTRGDRAAVLRILGDGDTAIEKMEPGLVLSLENGKPGGLGWIIRMPLGDRILVDLPGSGGCMVRAPRVAAGAIEGAFGDLLSQYAASGPFEIRRVGEQTKAVDAGRQEKPHGPDKSAAGNTQPDQVKYHFLVYSMRLPDTGNAAELALATTEARSVSFQATLSFQIPKAAQ